MTTYTLKLVSGVNYNLYNGATLVSDSDLATLFGSAGSAFFVFDFNSGTPTNTTSLTIVDSNSQAVITNTGLSGIAENTNFNGEWSASATAFDTFVKSPAAVLDEAQLSDLMGKIKEGGGGVITLKYSDYNPTLVTTPQPLGKFLYESGVKTGDTVVIENDTNEPYMYIVATEGVRDNFPNKTVPCYIINNNGTSEGSTIFQFYIYIYSMSQLYKWNYSISNNNYQFVSEELIISSKNVKPYGNDYYGSYDVLSAGSGNALSTLVQVATNIAGLSPVEGTFSGTTGFITCDQQKYPDDPEWFGEMEVSSTTPYDFESASVGTTIYVYVRSDAGLPLYYSPTDRAAPFLITDTSSNDIEVSEYLVDHSTGQPTSKFVNFVPGKYIKLKKFSNGWGFINSTTNAQYPSRIVNDGAITTAKIADGAVTTAKINDGAVTNAKIGSAAVKSGNIDWTTLIDKIYPVGSIYMSATLSTTTQVASALGGTWAAWGSGRVPVGVNTSDTDFNSVEKTGGNKTHTHGAGSYTTDLQVFQGNGIMYLDLRSVSASPTYTENKRFQTSNSSQASSHSETGDEGIAVSGTSGSGSSLQPYITCYMYKRTS